MAKTLRFKAKDEQGNISEQTYTVENTWILRNEELIRHEHYVHMASMAKIAPTDISCDVPPSQENGMMACYRIGGPDINGLMHYAVGSASPGNVKMQGQYFPEMAFKRAYDSCVTSALGIMEYGFGSQSAVDSGNIDLDDIGHPELVKVDFGKHRGKTLGEIWTEAPTWITEWLVSDKFQPRNDTSMFLKKAGMALLQKVDGGSTNINQPIQQQPQQQQFNQPTFEQQPIPVQQTVNPAVDINILKAELQNLWVTRGYDAMRAGAAINDFFKTVTINWQNITLEQVQQTLANKDVIFVNNANQQVPQQQVPQQQVPQQQVPQQQVPQQQVPQQQVP